MMGAPAATSYLNRIGFSRGLLVKYKSSGWLESFGRGAYIRSGDRVDWPGALYTLQMQLGLSIHAGGKTALERKGLAHYLPATQRRIFLYGSRGLVLPAWFRKARFGVEVIVTRTNLFPADFREGFTEFKERDFTVRISSPERAIMEMLHLVPHKVGFDEARLVMGNLTTLRPEVVQRLLETCRSVKVKRLFFFMAGNQELPWLPKVDPLRVNLGNGKRVVVPNGRYDAKYRITVPRDREKEIP